MNKGKYIRNLLMLLIVFASSGLFAQSSFKEINEKSLAHYNNAEWDSVIYYGKLAKKNNIDYYYLTYRLAVANFYIGDYYTASYYFDKAFEQNIIAKSDLAFIDLYYRALLYTKQNCTADRLFTNTDALDSNVRMKHRGNIYLSYINGNAFAPIEESKLRMDDGKAYSQLNYQQTINTIGIGGNFAASGKLELDFRYAFSRIGMIAAVENQVEFNIRNYTMDQHVFNIKPRLHINSKNTIDLAFGYHSVNGKPYGIWDSTLVMDFKDYDNSSLMLGLSYKYRFKKVQIGINGVYSNFYDRNNIQFGASFRWFPKGNLNLYSITEVSAFKAGSNSIRPVLFQKVGGKVANKMWLEGSAIIGDVQNFTMINYNYSFELAYKTKAMLNAKLIYVFSDKWNFYFGPQYTLSSANKIQEDLLSQPSTIRTAKGPGNGGGPDQQKNLNNNEIGYSQFNIVGGIQWKF